MMISGKKVEWLGPIRITPEMMAKVRGMADETGHSLAGMVRVLMRYGIEWVEREREHKEGKGAGR
jgi:hypothetical protein